ncbi:MAG: type II secretion system protein M [Tahibacter sp.]
MMRAWWSARDAREQRILLIGGVLVAVLFAWALIWYPLSSSAEGLRRRVQTQRADLAQMQSLAATATQLRGQGARSHAERQGKSLLALADATARGAQLANTLKRVEPAGAKTVRVTFEGASFDAIADWLDGLARDFGVVANDFSADRSEGTGLVNARVTLQDP